MWVVLVGCSEPAEGKEDMQSSRRGSSLQHGQKRCRFHIWDVDFILVLGQLAVEHGVEHRTAHGQNILWEDSNRNTVERIYIGYTVKKKKIYIL